MTTVDDYLNELSAPERVCLEHIRALVKETVPEAEEGISYGMPGFKYKGRPLIYYAAFKDHMSLYPASGGILEAMSDQIASFRTSKGTLQFTIDNTVPDAVIKELLLQRIREITALKK